MKNCIWINFSLPDGMYTRPDEEVGRAGTAPNDIDFTAEQTKNTEVPAFGNVVTMLPSLVASIPPVKKVGLVHEPAVCTQSSFF